ncbi:hypothetical protein Dac01nite_00900 [Demequina activiva]|uniref:Uncharacterized protein n=1 Tax=Demequina activiva TaxID=1582364 RepID=A0A919UK43_9MICO|nr:hypothetical protein Dac01nite_00900 [Demequina activiva]
MPRHLVAVLHSPPLGDGLLTLGRVNVARNALNCETVSIANIYSNPLANVNALPYAADDGWQRARAHVRRELDRADATDVLLAYGVQAPSGAHRSLYLQQRAWLKEVLRQHSLRVWTFGDRPYHPSRWQRVTYRHEPGASIEQLAPSLLTPLAL